MSPRSRASFRTMGTALMDRDCPCPFHSAAILADRMPPPPGLRPFHARFPPPVVPRAAIDATPQPAAWCSPSLAHPAQPQMLPQQAAGSGWRAAAHPLPYIRCRPRPPAPPRLPAAGWKALQQQVQEPVAERRLRPPPPLSPPPSLPPPSPLWLMRPAREVAPALVIGPAAARALVQGRAAAQEAEEVVEAVAAAVAVVAGLRAAAVLQQGSHQHSRYRPGCPPARTRRGDARRGPHTNPPLLEPHSSPARVQ